MDPRFKEIVSIHGNNIPFIADSEILFQFQPVRHETIVEHARSVRNNPNDPKDDYTLEVQFTKDGRSIIQQQAVRGCTAGVAAMLIKDNGGQVSVATLKGRNLGNIDSIRTDLEHGGVEPIQSEIAAADGLPALDALLQRDGPAIVSVGGEIGGHVILVDALDFKQNLAAIRDPYHGWAILIPLKSLSRRMGSTGTIQIMQARARPEAVIPPKVRKLRDWFRKLLKRS